MLSKSELVCLSFPGPCLLSPQCYACAGNPWQPRCDQGILFLQTIPSTSFSFRCSPPFTAKCPSKSPFAQIFRLLTLRFLFFSPTFMFVTLLKSLSYRLDPEYFPGSPMYLLTGAQGASCCLGVNLCAVTRCTVVSYPENPSFQELVGKCARRRV